MNSATSFVFTPRHLWRATWLIAVLWTLAVAASVVWNAHLLHETMLEAATHDARTSCTKDLLYLLNPVYMTREVHAMKAQADDILGHITSLNPLNPENAPDAWEAAALGAFKQGQTEVISREPLHGQQQLRYMKPFLATAACLKCHADKGYKVGEFGGGISVTVPLDPYLVLAQAQLWPIAGVHSVLWALGAMGIFLGARQMRQRLDKQFRAEEALRRSETKFRTLYDSTSAAVMLLDPNGFFDCNQATLTMFGCATQEEFCSKHPADVSPPVQPDGTDSLTLAKQHIRTAMKKGSHHFEWMYKRTGTGETFPVEVLLSAMELDGKPVLQAVVRDITERKRAQAELENVHMQLLEASRRGGMAEIATNVLHNVGNALNSVNISTGLIVESVKKSRISSLARVMVLLREHAHDLGAFITTDPKGKHVPAHLAQLSEHLQSDQEAIVGELDSLRRNVEHIKEIVAMQQNYATFGGVREIINVADLVEDSLRMNEGALSRHHVEVIREFENVPPMNVDKHKILQILVNLLRNAKHACDESERADKRLTVRVANGEGRVKISVIDNGVGIPPENLIRIFNHGFTTRKGGHGFGLHSGALAAREMGGSLTVHSDGPGQGAAFTLELPLPNAGELT